MENVLKSGKHNIFVTRKSGPVLNTYMPGISSAIPLSPPPPPKKSRYYLCLNNYADFNQVYGICYLLSSEVIK
jgi:hypothetical protein